MTFQEPIDFRKYQDSIAPSLKIIPYEDREDRKKIVYKLGFDIVHKLTQGMKILPVTILATVLLCNWKGMTMI